MSEPNPLAQKPNPEPITPTAAHRSLVADIVNYDHEAGALLPWDDCAQLIAASEARALASLAMVAADSADRNVSLRLENDQLRAEVERLTNQRDNLLKPMREQAIARAELAEAAETVALAQWNGALERAMKAEAELATERENAERYRLTTLKLDAELATERARLDWLEFRGPWEAWSEPCGEADITLRGPIRAAIDAAMKEDAK